MNQRAAAIATLVLLAAILPETLSGNTPTHVLLQPGPLLFFVIAYGLPVLLIREFATRNSISLARLFLIGMGYGIINEALLAKTVFRNSGVPVDIFEEYGFVFGIQWAWTAFILPWHAVASVMLPISFAHRAVPLAAGRNWLGIRSMWALAIILFALCSLFFLFEDISAITGTVLMLVILWVAIAALVIVAWILPANPRLLHFTISKWRLVALGYGGIIPFLSLLAIAHFRWPLVIYFAVATFWVALYRFFIRQFENVDHAAFGWFGFGWYLQIGTFSWLGAAGHYPYMVVTDLIALVLLWWILRRQTIA